MSKIISNSSQSFHRPALLVDRILSRKSPILKPDMLWNALWCLLHATSKLVVINITVFVLRPATVMKRKGLFNGASAGVNHTGMILRLILQCRALNLNYLRTKKNFQFIRVNISNETYQLKGYFHFFQNQKKGSELFRLDCPPSSTKTWEFPVWPYLHKFFGSQSENRPETQYMVIVVCFNKAIVVGLPYMA